MPRYAYVNGHYVPHSKAIVHIEDRGYQFADGVYEVIALVNGTLADERGHLDRMERSLGELNIDMPVSRKAIQVIMRELIRKNRARNAAIYIQVTRGVAKRDFKYPDPDFIRPSLVMTCRSFQYDGNPNVKNGVKIITAPDQRWARRDIKTIALLPQTIAKQKAAEAGAYETWMVGDDGIVTEGSSSNAWILKDGILKTHPADTRILKGVTRAAVEGIAKENGYIIDEKSFTPDEAYHADEAFCTSATSLIVPVIEIDGHLIGGGKPGDIAGKIYEWYRKYASKGPNAQYKWSANEK